MSTSFKPNSAGIAALLVSGPMQAAMLAAGQDVAAEAARRAPRASGALAASFHTEPTTATIKTRGGTSRRASGRVIADVPHAAATEFGHATQAGPPVPGAHTLGLLAAAKSARGRRRT